MDIQSKEPIFVIYQITNLVNGKIYVGQHRTFDVNDGYMGSGRLIVNAINKYGVGAFQKDILFTFSSKEEMNAKEAELVNEEFVRRKDTYNMALGGTGGFYHIDKEKRLEGIKNHYKDSREMRICKWCETSFEVRLHEAKKFCSRSCGAKFNNDSRKSQPNTSCAWCDKPIVKDPHVMRSYPRHFCCKSHQVHWYNQNRERNGREN